MVRLSLRGAAYLLGGVKVFSRQYVAELAARLVAPLVTVFITYLIVYFIDDLHAGLSEPNVVISAHTADALEKVARSRPDLI